MWELLISFILVCQALYAMWLTRHIFTFTRSADRAHAEVAVLARTIEQASNIEFNRDADGYITGLLHTVSVKLTGRGTV